MKKSFSTCFLLLAASVLGVMLNDVVYDKGSEGESAVINCSYAAQYKTSHKYFCKGIQEDCKTLIKSDGQNEWTLEGRLSLHDNKEKNIFVVNINNLSSEDSGRYGCGVEITGQDLITVVHLTVMKERHITAATYRSESVTETTGSSTRPRESQTLSGIYSYIRWTFGGILLVLLVIFCVFEFSVVQSSAGTI
ncbi:polymeric immunoglobulin receptor-like [Tachysurus fulvidraco]|uniref:polymeric immunoglobulin receptor-like n=1 Tax=Tachysurus fulvidraco TaxID=1234273 RepID=UPI001FEFC8F8|nr:polymeric immunoglobulin receptor-like [Tachysurus fulvidraco]